MNSFLFFQEGLRNNFKIKKIAYVGFAILFGIVFLLSQNFFVQADEQDPPEFPELQLTKSIEPETVYQDGITRVTLELKGTGLPYEQRSPVDVMHAIDISGSMSWYGDIIYPDNYDNSEGILSDEWKQIDTFEIKIDDFLNSDDSLNSFEALLLTNSSDRNQELEIISPTGIRYDHHKTSFHEKSYYGADYLRITNNEIEYGIWQVEAKGKSNRPYVFSVSKMPVRLDAAKDAAKYFIDIMQENDQVGVVSFSNRGSLKRKLTPLDGDINRNLIKDEIDGLRASGATAIGEGLEKAIDELDKNGREPFTRVIVLLSDGVETENSDPLGKAQEAKDNGIIIFTIGFGEADEDLLKGIADKTEGKYYYADNASELEKIYNQISQEFSDVVASGAVLTDILPKDIEYAGNATVNNSSKEPDEIIENPDDETTTLIWNLGKIKIGDEFSVSFDVKVHKESGKHSANVYPDSRVDFYNYLGEESFKEFPETFVNVISEGEEPEPSPTPGPSPSPSSGGSSYIPPKKYPDMSISITDGQMIADPNQILEYSISYANIGDTEAKNVKVIDILPDFVDFISASDGGIYGSENNQVVWNLGNILAGISRILNLQVKVFPETPAEGAVLTNKVEIKTASEDSDLSNNQAEDITNIGAVQGAEEKPEGEVEGEEVLPKAGIEFSIILLITMIAMGMILEIKERLLKSKS
jgi:uncharacterized repeat protein (TIGR01451 family)